MNQDGQDYYWTREADASMGLDYNGYGYYGQTAPDTSDLDALAPEETLLDDALTPQAVPQKISAFHVQPTPAATWRQAVGAPTQAMHWTQPGVGYQPAYTPGAMVPVASPFYYAPPTNHPNATASIVLGILGLVMFPPLSYISLVMALRGRKDLERNPGVYAPDSMTAGLVLGAIGSALCTLYIMFFTAMMVAIMFSY